MEKKSSSIPTEKPRKGWWQRFLERMKKAGESVGTTGCG